MTPRGFEHPQKSRKKQRSDAKAKQKPKHILPIPVEADSHIAAIEAATASLPDAIRAAILALVAAVQPANPAAGKPIRKARRKR
jgi:hypothetical protein